MIIKGWHVRTLFLALWIILSVGCSYFQSTQQIEKEVQAQIQAAFDSQQNFKDYHFKINQLNIIDQQSNPYMALAEIEYQGKIHQVTVEISHGGTDLTWRIPANNFAFVQQAQRENYQKELDEKLNAIQLTEQDRLSYDHTHAASAVENVDELFIADATSASEVIENGVNLSTALLNEEDQSINSSEVAENLEQKSQIGLDLAHLESKNLYKNAIQEQMK